MSTSLTDDICWCMLLEACHTFRLMMLQLGKGVTISTAFLQLHYPVAHCTPTLRQTKLLVVLNGIQIEPTPRV